MPSTHKKTTKRQGIAAVDLFCGVAGLSYGLKQGGVKVVAGVDLDPACRFPFETNIGARFIQQDVNDLSGEAVNALFSNAKVRVLAGCAPCQPFSGYTTKRRKVDGRWQLLLEFLRVVKAIRPEIVTLENVPRLSQLPLWAKVVDELKAESYHVSWGIVDASDYGVSQKRKRLVLLASTLGAIELPTPRKKRSPPTVRQAIGDLPSVAAGTVNPKDRLHVSRALTERNLLRIRASRPAGTWREWPTEMIAECHRSQSGKTYPSVYGRMSWDDPAPTITTQFYGFGNGRFGHPEQDRAITLREGALLQSFPAKFHFSPPGRRVNFREIGRLIGNAVPPALGKAIGSVIVDHVAALSR
jgi:DNA (cytosine-5)-methyltransferase 1